MDVCNGVYDQMFMTSATFVIWIFFFQFIPTIRTFIYDMLKSSDEASANNVSSKHIPSQPLSPPHTYTLILSLSSIFTYYVP